MLPAVLIAAGWSSRFLSYHPTNAALSLDTGTLSVTTNVSPLSNPYVYAHLPLAASIIAVFSGASPLPQLPLGPKL